MNDLVDLYGDLERRLAKREEYYPERREPEWSALQEALDAVIEQLWEGASTEAARRPPPELERLGEHPIFVLGYYKSGTSLLLDLLDGHPELIALPGESRHFTSLVPRAGGVRALHAHWIRNTITPYGIPPRWLLGRPAHGDPDPYDAFGRDVVAFARARGGRDSLAATAQALASATGSSAGAWVEKTPTHEFHLDSILSAYPEARFIHIVRDPRSTIASIGRFSSETPIVDPLSGSAELARSFSVALDARRRLGERYTLVRYEDLVADTTGTMHRIAECLGIVFDSALMVPTTLSVPATANAGKPERRVTGAVHQLSIDRRRDLVRRERILVNALVGQTAQELGYEVKGGSRVVAVAARALLYARYRIARTFKRDRAR